MDNLLEINDDDRQAIADQVAEGYTSGRLDVGDDTHITWSIDMEKWKDDE